MRFGASWVGYIAMRSVRNVLAIFLIVALGHNAQAGWIYESNISLRLPNGDSAILTATIEASSVSSGQLTSSNVTSIAELGHSPPTFAPAAWTVTFVPEPNSLMLVGVGGSILLMSAVSRKRLWRRRLWGAPPPHQGESRLRSHERSM